MVVRLPEHVRQKVMRAGVEGRNWLRCLPDLIALLENRWEIAAERSPLDGGSEACILPVTRCDGTRAVLKLGAPPIGEDGGFRSEAAALLFANGRGYARVLEHDVDLRALLLERLGMSLRESSLPTREKLRILCHDLERCWVPVPPEIPLLSGAHVAEGLAQEIVDLSGEFPSWLSKDTTALCLSYLDALARDFSLERAVLVHGDAHDANSLQCQTDDGSSPCFKFIDPDGIRGDRAYDLGVLMREWSPELTADPVRLGNARCEYLSSLTNVNREVIWQWGFIQTVSTGLLLVKVGRDGLGRELLAVAHAWTLRGASPRRAGGADSVHKAHDL